MKVFRMIWDIKYATVISLGLVRITHIKKPL